MATRTTAEYFVVLWFCAIALNNIGHLILYRLVSISYSAIAGAARYIILVGEGHS
jgi:hypothetical protein